MAITKDQVTKKVKLDLSGLSREAKARAKNEAGRIIVEEIQRALDNSNTPVSGGSFSKAKVKSGRNAGSVSRLLDTGDLRNSIDAKNRKGDVVEVGVFKKKETPIAFNHNTGDTVPQRQFIPEESQEFKKTIMSRVNEVIDDIRSAEGVGQRDEEDRLSLADVLSTLEAAGTGQVTTTSGTTLLLRNLFDDDFLGGF